MGLTPSFARPGPVLEITVVSTVVIRVFVIVSAALASSCLGLSIIIFVLIVAPSDPLLPTCLGLSKSVVCIVLLDHRVTEPCVVGDHVSAGVVNFLGAFGSRRCVGLIALQRGSHDWQHSNADNQLSEHEHTNKVGSGGIGQHTVTSWAPVLESCWCAVKHLGHQHQLIGQQPREKVSAAAS